MYFLRHMTGLNFVGIILVARQRVSGSTLFATLPVSLQGFAGTQAPSSHALF